MSDKPPFVMPPSVKAEMEATVSEGVFTYLYTFSKALFPDFRESPSQEAILNGLADAIQRYEHAVGKPIVQTLALNLLDHHKENSK